MRLSFGGQIKSINLSIKNHIPLVSIQHLGSFCITEIFLLAECHTYGITKKVNFTHIGNFQTRAKNKITPPQVVQSVILSRQFSTERTLQRQYRSLIRTCSSPSASRCVWVPKINPVNLNVPKYLCWGYKCRTVDFSNNAFSFQINIHHMKLRYLVTVWRLIMNIKPSPHPNRSWLQNFTPNTTMEGDRSHSIVDVEEFERPRRNKGKIWDRERQQDFVRSNAQLAFWLCETLSMSIIHNPALKVSESDVIPDRLSCFWQPSPNHYFVLNAITSSCQHLCRMIGWTETLNKWHYRAKRERGITSKHTIKSNDRLKMKVWSEVKEKVNSSKVQKETEEMERNTTARPKNNEELQLHPTSNVTEKNIGIQQTLATIREIRTLFV